MMIPEERNTPAFSDSSYLNSRNKKYAQVAMHDGPQDLYS